MRTLLGSVRPAAPALVCGGTLAYQFSSGTAQALCSFAGREETVLQKLPSAVGLGIALQMTDGTTRVLRMSEALEAHLREEWTPFVLSNAADVRGEDVLRILLYQDKKQMPLLPLLDQALGEAGNTVLAARTAPDTLVLTPGAVSGTAMFNAGLPARRRFGRGADRGGQLRPDARSDEAGGLQRGARRRGGRAAPCRQPDYPDRPRQRRGGRVSVWPGAPCGSLCVKNL